MKIQTILFALLLASCQSEMSKPETQNTPAPAAPPASVTQAETPAPPPVPTEAVPPAPKAEKAPAPVKHTSAVPKTPAPKLAMTHGFANTIDPICDMEVMASWTDTAHYHHKVYAFCSEYCKEAFKADPKKYLAIMK